MTTPGRTLPALKLDQSNLGPAMLALSPQRQMFVHALIFGGMSQKDAAISAGYSDKPDSAKSIGSNLAHTPAIQEAMLECSKQLLRAEGANSVRKLVHLRDYAEDEKVQLRAATELMDRMGGLAATTQHNVDVIHRHQLSTEEYDRRFAAACAELGIPVELARKGLVDPKNRNIIDAEYEDVTDDGREGIEDLL